MGAAHDVNAKLLKEIDQQKAAVKQAVGAKRKIDKAEVEAATAAQALEEEKETSKRIRLERKSYYNLLRYQRNQTAELRQRIADIGDVEQLRAEHEQLLEEFNKLREENDEMRAEIAEKEAIIDQLRDAAEPIIQTKDTSGAYTPEFRTLVYRLLGKNIPQANLSSAIRDVLVLAKREASDLPTTKSIRRMNIERGDVAQQHVAVSCFDIQ